MFFKRNDLGERQTLHFDWHGVGVVAIYVEKCGRDGYSFHYVEKSHHRMRHGDSERKICVPTSAVKELKVKKGDLILFPSCLIHAGGQASSTECLHTKFIKFIPQNEEKNNYDEWTDISYQFTLAHALFPSPISQGKGVILPFIRDEEKHSKAEFQEKRYEDVQIDEQKFKQYVNEPGFKFKEILDASLSVWIKKLDGEKVYITRSRVSGN
jgi:ribosomal protein L16 Arg81 hydroxylase